MEGLLEQPLRWRKPLRIFVNSMGDLFHETLAPIDILKVLDVMLRANWHVFQILTKRGGRVRELSGQLRWAPHIWMGVSVENADYGDRIDELRATGAQIKFLSLEPLLGPLEHLDLGGIDWIIVGGESGPGARPMKLEWARSIIRQCRAAGVACFVKQLGAKPIDRDAPLQLSDRKGGDLQEWPPDLRVREFPGALAEKGAL